MNKTTVIALLALFFSLSGGAFAAGTLIDGHSLRVHSVPADRLTLAAEASLRGQRGPQGIQGVAGPKGDTGMSGSTVTLVKGADVTAAPSSYALATAQCPAGARAVAGGWFAGPGLVYVQSSTPDSVSNGTWDVNVYNGSSVTDTMHVWATCATP
jgi:hypothetical protein